MKANAKVNKMKIIWEQLYKFSSVQLQLFQAYYGFIYIRSRFKKEQIFTLAHPIVSHCVAYKGRQLQYEFNLKRKAISVTFYYTALQVVHRFRAKNVQSMNFIIIIYLIVEALEFAKITQEIFFCILQFIFVCNSRTSTK